MTAKAATPMPEGIIRPKAPCAPPKPPLMRVGCNRHACPMCGSGMKPYLGVLGSLFNVSKGCYQSECENYWRNK